MKRKLDDRIETYQNEMKNNNRTINRMMVLIIAVIIIIGVLSAIGIFN